MCVFFEIAATMPTARPPIVAVKRVGDAPKSMSDPERPGTCQASFFASVTGSSLTTEYESPTPFPVVTKTALGVAATLLQTLPPTWPSGTEYHVASTSPVAWSTDRTP